LPTGAPPARPKLRPVLATRDRAPTSASLARDSFEGKGNGKQPGGGGTVAGRGKCTAGRWILEEPLKTGPVVSFFRFDYVLTAEHHDGGVGRLWRGRKPQPVF